MNDDGVYVSDSGDTFHCAPVGLIWTKASQKDRETD